MKKIKKICAGLISAAVITASMVTSSSAVLRGSLGGDANGDGVVNITDAFYLYDYISGFETQINYYNADVNTDGYLTEADVLILFAHIDGFDNKGDVNNDGDIDAMDLACMVSFLVGNQVSYLHCFNADMDNDGYITSVDKDILRGILLS